MSIQCFLIHLTGLSHRYLRRYAGENKCEASGLGYCNAGIFIDKGLIGEPSTTVVQDLDKTDHRWPQKCSCGSVFKEEDTWQLNIKPEYARADNAAEVFTLDNAPVGAMWQADWFIHGESNEYRGPDGHCLVVRTPGGDWVIDGKASNCTLPDDNEHKCWVRHGQPPFITVNKNGITCAAGAGSIAIGNYHGFLTDGKLIQA